MQNDILPCINILRTEAAISLILLSIYQYFFFSTSVIFNQPVLLQSYRKTPRQTPSRLLGINHLTPNGHYMGRTAQLTSRCFIIYIYIYIYIYIQQIYVLNILNMLHNLRLFLFKMQFISQCYLFWFLYYSHFKYRLC